MHLRERYMVTEKEEISRFLREFYAGTREGVLVNNLVSEGKSVIELPSDFEPLHLNKKSDEGLVKKISNSDFIILYHGTSTIFQDEIEKKGLLPRKLTGNGNFTGDLESIEDSVYVGQLNYFGNIFDSVKLHAHKVAKKAGGFPLLIRAVVPVASCLLDEDVKGASNGIESIVYGGTARLIGGIKPKFLFMYPQGPETLEKPYRTKINEFCFPHLEKFFN